MVGDFVLDRGWAYASHDKGNTGLNFFRAGDTETDGDLRTWVPPRALEQWGPMMEKTALGAQGVLGEHFGGAPSLTYASGVSNGGYQTRLALERYPEIFDGGVDWEGTLIRPEAPNIFTDVPIHLRNYPAWRLGDRDAYRAMVHDSHLPPDSRVVWDQHHTIYWSPVASAYRPVIDPEFTNFVATVRTPVLPGDPDAEYDYESRPDFVRERVAKISNTGQVHGKPFITIGPSLDALLPIQSHADIYADMVRASGNAENFRYYAVENGNHVDQLADSRSESLRPVLPCYLDALDALDSWVVDGTPPPPSGFVPFPAEDTHEQRANDCALPSPVDRAAGADRIGTAIAASRGGFTTAEAVVLAAAGNFPDALAAAPLAAANDAPLLLVGSALTPELERELDRLGAFDAIIVGGPAAVPAAVEEEVAAFGLTVRRLSGPDRFATAAAIAADLCDSAEEAFVVSGEAFPDALSIAPVAASSGTPILLTAAGTLPAATADAIRDLGIERTVVVGGEAAVSAAVAALLLSPQRIAGPDRYATSAAVARFAAARGADLSQIGIATGRGFADARAAGPTAHAGYGGAPGGGIVLLADGADATGAGPTFDFLTANRDVIEGVIVFGGPAAVTAAVTDRIASSLRSG